MKRHRTQDSGRGPTPANSDSSCRWGQAVGTKRTMSGELSDVITGALNRARYNETVQIEVNEDYEICLVACLDEDNGGIQWNQIGALKDEILKRHLRTKRWFIPMLKDHRRNELYQLAVRKACSSVLAQIKNMASTESLILDIGSGSGLLGMIAAKSLQDLADATQDSLKVRVTSIEMASAMAELARRTVAENHLQNVVDVVEGHSCLLPPIAPKAIFCVSELLETGLLGEGLLPALRDAWKRHLTRDAIVLPQRARVFAQLVDGEWLSQWHGPHSLGVENEFIRLSLDQRGSHILDAGSVRLDCHGAKLLRDKKIRPLTEPVAILDIGFGRTDIPGPQGSRSTTATSATEAGQAKALLVWWELQLWEDVVYSTEPGKEPWQDHWHQSLLLLDDAVSLQSGQPIQLHSFHNDSRVWVELCAGDLEGQAPASKLSRLDDTEAECTISPYRCLLLNDIERLSSWRKATTAVLAEKGLDARVLDVSDFSFCATLAAKSGARNVVSVEASSGNLPLTSARLAQIGNGLPAEGSHFEILKVRPEDLTLETLGGKPVDIVIGEPYYETLEGWHLQEALNFGFLVRGMRRKGLLCEDAVIVPSRCQVLACGIESESIRAAYRGDKTICGLTHESIEQLWSNAHDFDLCLSMEEYDYRKLTEPMELATISFDSGSGYGDVRECSSYFTTSGTCDALLVWVEYKFGTAAEDSLSTLRDGYRQSVRIIDKSVFVEANCVGKTKLVCQSRFGGLDSGESHSLEIYIVE